MGRDERCRRCDRQRSDPGAPTRRDGRARYEDILLRVCRACRKRGEDPAERDGRDDRTTGRAPQALMRQIARRQCAPQLGPRLLLAMVSALCHLVTVAGPDETSMSDY